MSSARRQRRANKTVAPNARPVAGGVLKLPLAVLRKIAADAKPFIKDRDRRLENAWRHADFRDALHLAVQLNLTQPMDDYLTAGKPLTADDGRALLAYIRTLRKPRRGRPRYITKPQTRSLVQKSEHAAAALVRQHRHAWLRDNNRRRMPARETKKLIVAACKEAFEEYGRRPDSNRVLGLLQKHRRGDAA